MKKILMIIILVAAAALGYKYFGQEQVSNEPETPSTSTTETGQQTTDTQESNQSASTEPAKTEEEKEEKKTLVFCSEGSPEHFAPSMTYSGVVFTAAGRTVFNRLVETVRGKTDLAPGLAESWTLSEDGKVFTFNLRKGVKFHTTKDFTPTRDFNADDVLFTFNRQLKKDHPYHQVSGGNYGYFISFGLDKLIEKVEKVDDYTVKFHFTKPDSAFLSIITVDFASILSAEYADKLMKEGRPQDLDLKPVGTGPYILTNYQKDAAIRYKANNEYWEGQPTITDLIFVITPDASVRMSKLRKGECHLMSYPSLSDIPVLKADENIDVIEQEGLNVGYLAFNTQKKPYDDLRVRRALTMAVDKQTIIDSVFQGGGVVAHSMVPPIVWSHNADVKDYNFDVEAAKKLLEEAGLAQGFKTKLWAMPVARPYNPNAKKMAEIIQADWAKIGVDAEIVSYEWAEYLERSKKGEHETLLLGWGGDTGDPDNFLYTNFSCDGVRSGNNTSFWCYQPFETLLQKAKLTADIGERTKFYKEAQKIFIEQVPATTIAHSKVFQPVRKEVIGYKVIPINVHEFFGVDIKTK